MANSKEQEVLDLERGFWETMKTKDGKSAAAMTADGCIVAGASGVSAIDSAMMEQMMAGGKWTLEKYSFDEKSRVVRFVNDDLAIVGYRVDEQLQVEGKPVTLQAYDTSVWSRRDGKWMCVLHTESVAGDPYGRDRVTKS